MLGDKLGNEAGKVTLQRVVSSPAGTARTETTQRGTGTLLGVPYQVMTTYQSELRADGTIYGQGRGIYMGKGGEVASWTGSGVGTPSKSGGVSFRGAIYIYSTAPKWQRVNGVAGIFEYEVDADDNYKAELFEWK
jgi:hypothetical protein